MTTNNSTPDYLQSWDELPLPPWLTSLRPHQETAIQQIMEAFEGKSLVVLDAPTGAGKSAIGEITRLLLAKHHGLSKSTYICHSKSLQDQFARDYPTSRVLKGKSNYPTGLLPEKFDPMDWKNTISCADCTGKECGLCGEYEDREETCPYFIAKGKARDGGIAVVNTAYFLNETISKGSMLSNRGSVIADEADTLEGELLNAVSVDIPKGVTAGVRAPKVTVNGDWPGWIRVVLEEVRKQRGAVKGDDMQSKRRLKSLTELKGKLTAVLAELEDEDLDETYVLNGDGRFNNYSFQPVSVTNYGMDRLYRHSKKWLLMSATTINPGELLESTGWWDDGRKILLPYGYVEVKSTFPVANRPIYPKPVAELSHRVGDRDWGKLSTAVIRIAEARPNDRIIVHAVNYKLTGYLAGELRSAKLGREVISYSNAAGREPAISEYKLSPAGILVGPSIERGVDLPGDLCRVQVVCKLPHLNLGDRRTSARVYGTRNGQTWYAVQTVRSLVQATGRGVRSEEDYAETFILDAAFISFAGKNGGLFPKWWADAICWVDRGSGVGNLVT